MEPDEKYRQFFKVLLEFETLERDRPTIDVMISCFDDSVELLEKEPQPEKYRSQLEVLITAAMQNLSRPWQKIERPISRADIRSRLALYSKVDVASIHTHIWRLVRWDGDIKDIDLAVIETPDPQIRNLEDKEGKIRQNVSLHNLFDEREVKEKTIRPKRIWIQGKPGIGKTTLCRRLMYEYFWNEKLRTKFDRVVRIPARKLERSGKLRSLFFEEYFEDAQNGHALSKELENLILAHASDNSGNEVTTSIQILLILDGLEEVTGYSQGRNTLLKMLIKGPAVIITSRFSDIKMPCAPIDVHLEALGLSPTNVDAYLENNMFIAKDLARRQIRGFITASALVKDMIRVPIHLDIVCYSWDQLYNHPGAFSAAEYEEEISTPIMATFYQSVVRSLWRKDIPKLAKMDHDEPMTDETINVVQDFARLDRLVNTENELLEEIAINMLKADQIEFTNQDVANVIQQWESNGNQIPLSLESKIHKFHLLRSSSREGHRTFRFIHLTFQDFFAARYIVRSLVQGPSQLRNLLRRCKYNRQYELFWRFIPGLLTNVKDLDLFFQLLDQEPRDLLGMQHIRLVMHCWHEWPTRLKSRRWEELVRRLEDWLVLEHNMGGFWHDNNLGSSMAFPENILARQLDPRTSRLLNEYDSVIDTISDRMSLSEALIRYIIHLRDDRLDDFSRGRIRALDMPLSLGFMDDMLQDPTRISFLRQLRKAKKLPESIYSLLLDEIREDTTLEIRESTGLTPREERHCYTFGCNALDIMMTRSTLPDNVMEKLEDWFRSEDLRLATIANSILERQRGQITLSKKTSDHAVEAKFIRPNDGSTGWDYRWMLCRKDLPRETATRLLAWLFREARTVEYFYNCPFVQLQPENVEEVGTLLYLCLHHDQVWEKDFDSLWSISSPQATDDPQARIPLIEIEQMTDTALFILEHQKMEDQTSLPSGILKMVVRILDWNLDQLDSGHENNLFEFDKSIQAYAVSILKRQPEFHDDVVVELQNMFNNNRNREAVLDLVKGRLRLFDEIYTWAVAIVTDHLRPQAMQNHHEPEHLPEILGLLSGEPDLPESFVNSLVYTLPNILEEKIASLGTNEIEFINYLLNLHRELSKGAIDGLVEVLRSTSISAIERLQNLSLAYER
ncbi:MAG: hypothetical protein L6R40_001989 [Gallowayella cf. fulva]|nr:MAG: hypothetical protein L6R40_001989 [Xanthomendoza cf. fulva]